MDVQFRTTLSNEDDQKIFSEKIMDHIRKTIHEDGQNHANFENVVQLRNYKNA